MCNTPEPVRPGPDDLRLEYEQVAENLRGGVTILWEAFKTYFTLAGLLFGIVGFPYGGDPPWFAESERAWLTLATGLIGLTISRLAALGIKRIIAYQRAFILRGRALEQAIGLSPGLMEQTRQIFEHGSSLDQSEKRELRPTPGSDSLTYIVFALFAIGFAVAIGNAIYVLCDLG